MHNLTVIKNTPHHLVIGVWDSDTWYGKLETRNNDSSEWQLEIVAGLAGKIRLPVAMVTAILWASVDKRPFSFILQ